MESDTGVLSLSNKRRQGMKLSYQLNVSVSDGVFTNTAQVRQLTVLFCQLICSFLTFAVFIHRKQSDLFLATPRFRFNTSSGSCAVHVHVISDLL